MHNLKFTGYILFRDINERLTIAWEAASQIALRNCSKEVREEPEYMGVYAEREKKKKKHIVEHQKYIASHKRVISKE